MKKKPVTAREVQALMSLHLEYMLSYSRTLQAATSLSENGNFSASMACLFDALYIHDMALEAEREWSRAELRLDGAQRWLYRAMEVV